ncbi:hypothetical protein DdX_22345 [Ditylenchus destructor]|uniref:Uncharacterized protein n=1 Tax=Ditylenchus destructor TaxID=166010 RepID=A0AAD4MDR4_9BILA|nr:hypothetical protein DdX_22345 [Ditylenchus destructor]
MTLPAMAGRLRRKRRTASWKRLRPFTSLSEATGATASVMANPRIEQAVENIDQQIEHDDEDGDQHDRAHDERIVAVDRAEHEVTPDAGNGEDRLDHRGAGEQCRRAGCEIGDDGQHGAAHGVRDDHRFRRQTIGTRGADVVGAQRLDHRAAGQPREDGKLRQRQRDRRQDEEAQRPVAPAAGRKPGEHDRENQRQHRADDEVRHRDANGRHRHDREVEHAVLPQRCDRADDNAADKRQQQRVEAELDGIGQSLPMSRRRYCPYRCEVLPPERLIELVGPHQVFHRGGRKRPFEIERPAGRKAHQEERNGDDDEQRQHGACEAPQNESKHGQGS